MRNMTGSGWAVLAFAAASLVAPIEAAAAVPPNPNRISIEESPASLGVYDAMQSDGYYSNEGALGMSVDVSYGRVLVRGLEVGLGASYRQPYSGEAHVFDPHLQVRGYLPLAKDRLELGATLRYGPAFIWLSTPDVRAQYVGPLAAQARIDASYWLTAHVAIPLWAGIFYGIGSPTSVSGRAADYFNHSTLIAATISVGSGVVFSF